MKNKWRRGVLAIIALTLTASGCYRYVPTSADMTPPGTGVRVLVTQAGAADLTAATGIDGATPLVEGTVAEVEEGALLMNVPVGVRQDGFVTSSIEQVVRVPLVEIVSLQRRELNAFATGMSITGGAAVIALLVAVIAKPLLGEEPGPPTPPDEFTASFSLFSVTIGR